MGEAQLLGIALEDRVEVIELARVVVEDDPDVDPDDAADGLPVRQAGTDVHVAEAGPARPGGLEPPAL